jgi:hypothetical protein
MGEVHREGPYKIIVHPEGTPRHKLPHCHVRGPQGETVVALPTIRPIAGPPLPREGRELVEKHYQATVAEWNRLNPLNPLSP